MSRSYSAASSPQIRDSISRIGSPRRVTSDHFHASRPAVIPSPEFSRAELMNQIAALRAELRDGRILQARQRSELDQESARVINLTLRYKEVKRERHELKTKLTYERGAVVATEKRLTVAVKNHAEAQDKCARTMVECEKLRIMNEELVLLNKELGVSKGDVEADFDRKVKDIRAAFKAKLRDAKVTFERELEGNEQKLLQEHLVGTQALQKELDGRDAKIKKLEHDLNRQCEINAMFTIDYDRETNFTKRLSVPLSIPATAAPGRISGAIIPNHSYHSSPRRPLTNIESNQGLKSGKRPRATNDCDEKVEYAPSKLSRPSPSGKTPRSGTPVNGSRDSIQRRSGSSHPYNPANRTQQLPTPSSSFRVSKRH